MEVTTEVVQAAIKQAIKDKIIPSHNDMDTYLHHWESFERIIQAALDVQDK